MRSIDRLTCDSAHDESRSHDHGRPLWERYSTFCTYCKIVRSQNYFTCDNFLFGNFGSVCEKWCLEFMRFVSYWFRLMSLQYWFDFESLEVTYCMYKLINMRRFIIIPFRTTRLVQVQCRYFRFQPAAVSLPQKRHLAMRLLACPAQRDHSC